MGQMACLELAFKYSGKNKCVYVWGIYLGGVYVFWGGLGLGQRQMKQDWQHVDNCSGLVGTLLFFLLLCMFENFYNTK